MKKNKKNVGVSSEDTQERKIDKERAVPTKDDLDVGDGLRPPANLDLEQKCAEFESGWKRALADYENLQKEMSSNLSKSRDRIKIDFVQQLLPVLDNFNQAVNFAPKSEDAEIANWLQGVTFIQKQFETVLSDMGVETIEASGQLDTSLHEAVGSKTEEGKEDQEILETIAPGWKIGETVIRPVKVIINEIEK